jgi:hypothetical protein
LTRWCAAARPAHPAPATATFFRGGSPTGEASARTELPRRRRSRQGMEGGGKGPPATRAEHPHIPSSGSEIPESRRARRRVAGYPRRGVRLYAPHTSGVSKSNVRVFTFNPPPCMELYTFVPLRSRISSLWARVK